MCTLFLFFFRYFLHKYIFCFPIHKKGHVTDEKTLQTLSSNFLININHCDDILCVFHFSWISIITIAFSSFFFISPWLQTHPWSFSFPIDSGHNHCILGIFSFPIGFGHLYIFYRLLFLELWHRLFKLASLDWVLPQSICDIMTISFSGLRSLTIA